MAFVLHLLLTIYIGSLGLWSLASASTGVMVVLAIGFLLMAGSLVTLTWEAVHNNWQPDYSGYGGGGQLASPRVAWANTQTWGRILWLLFALAFLSAFVLLAARSIFGVVLIVVAFVLAIVAMRMD